MTGEVAFDPESTIYTEQRVPNDNSITCRQREKFKIKNGNGVLKPGAVHGNFKARGVETSPYVIPLIVFFSLRLYWQNNTSKHVRKLSSFNS